MGAFPVFEVGNQAGEKEFEDSAVVGGFFSHAVVSVDFKKMGHRFSVDVVFDGSAAEKPISVIDGIDLSWNVDGLICTAHCSTVLPDAMARSLLLQEAGHCVNYCASPQ